MGGEGTSGYHDDYHNYDDDECNVDYEDLFYYLGAIDVLLITLGA